MALPETIELKEEIERQIEIMRNKIQVNQEMQRVLIRLINFKDCNKHWTAIPPFFDNRDNKPFIGNCSMKDQVFHSSPTHHMLQHKKKIQKWISNLKAEDKNPWNDKKDKSLLRLKKNDCTWPEIAKSLKKPEEECAFRYCKLKEKTLPAVEWNSEMDKRLIALVELYGEKEMYLIAKKFNEKREGSGLSQNQVAYRYRYMLRPDIKRGRWEPEEDAILIMGLRLLETEDSKKFPFQHLQALMKNKRTDAQIRDRMTKLNRHIPNLLYFRTKTPSKKRKRINLAKKKDVKKVKKINSVKKVKEEKPKTKKEEDLTLKKEIDTNESKNKKINDIKEEPVGEVSEESEVSDENESFDESEFFEESESSAESEVSNQNTHNRKRKIKFESSPIPRKKKRKL